MTMATIFMSLGRGGGSIVCSGRLQGSEGGFEITVWDEGFRQHSYMFFGCGRK